MRSMTAQETTIDAEMFCASDSVLPWPISASRLSALFCPGHLEPGISILKCRCRQSDRRNPLASGTEWSAEPGDGGLPTLVQQYKDLRINQVRTHDSMGPSEIDSQFDPWQWRTRLAHSRSRSTRRSRESGECQPSSFPIGVPIREKPASYNFAPTDKVIAAIRCQRRGSLLPHRPQLGRQHQSAG